MRMSAVTIDVDGVRLLEGEFIMSFLNRMDAWTRMEQNFRKQIMRAKQFRRR